MKKNVSEFEMMKGKKIRQLSKAEILELKDSIQRETEEPSNQINKLLDDQKSSMDRLQKEISDKKEEDNK